jgi:hypothetical protein
MISSNEIGPTRRMTPVAVSGVVSRSANHTTMSLQLKMSHLKLDRPVKAILAGVFLTSGSTSAHYIKGRLYTVSGGCGAPLAFHNTARKASLNVIDRSGRASRLLDTDADVDPTKILLGFTLNNYDARIDMDYQTAASTATTLGTAVGLTYVKPGQLYTHTGPSGGVSRYHWFRFKLDDIYNSTFPESSTSKSSLDSFELFYRPNPGKRLRGGKTFTGQQQQSLDAQP